METKDIFGINDTETQDTGQEEADEIFGALDGNDTVDGTDTGDDAGDGDGTDIGAEIGDGADSASLIGTVIDAKERFAELGVDEMDAIEKQKEYVDHLNAKGFDYGLIMAEAFVRGMRDIGYKSSGTAMDEVVDNAIEAGATDVVVLFGYDPKSDKKPTRLAIIDNGHGMTPEMIRAAVLWGGGNRGDRRMFGRYGYGLPSSSVSLGQQFTVYSRIPGGEWQKITIDLEQIADGTFYKENGRLAAPPAQLSSLPIWVDKHVEQALGGLTHGTVVVMEKLDRLNPKTTDALERELLQHFGVQYRNFVRDVNIHVNDKKVEAVDPLFLDPTARFYDENELRAQALKPTHIEVKDQDTKKVIGVITVRYSYMPPGFQTNDMTLRGTKNARFNIMKDNNGILVLRAGRQIDVVSSKCPWLTFVNYDRNWKVEIDFTPSLDEEFSITTSKQQVVLSERMWKLLESAGVWRTIKEELRPKVKNAFDQKRQQEEDEKQAAQRAAEKAMAEAKKYKNSKPQTSPEQQEESKKKKQQEVDKRVKETGKTKEEVEREIEAEVLDRPYKVIFEYQPEGPYYRVDNLDTQVVVVINKAHPFYTDVYMSAESTPHLRSGLEVQLLVMAECELDAKAERQFFYKEERQLWSSRFSTALRVLEQYDPKEDLASANMEDEEVAAAAKDASKV